MTDKLKQVLISEEFTIAWRLFIVVVLLLATFSTWEFKRQIGRIDDQAAALKTHSQKIFELQQFMTDEFVKKDELCELKADVKAIQKTLNTTMPEISRFMGQTAEYMRTDGGRK